jgi:predicted enzyme related to lactoylglutathione lyase
MTQSLQSAEHDRRIDYIELPVTDIAGAKRFYGETFGWRFEDYGPDYASFADGRLTGGFAKVQAVRGGGPLIVIFALDLEAVEKRVRDAGGKVVRPTFSFPGGRRFHFADPSGNELAVWSDRTP